MTSEKRSLIITNEDFKRLNAMLNLYEDETDAARLLEDKLARAEVMEVDKTPKNIITMNSVFRAAVLDGEVRRQEKPVYSLVYPKKADAEEGRISILAPLGLELLGSRTGDTVVWHGHDGAERRLIIEDVIYQPEASGDWHL